jgi:triosephosphate isomerase (TIM)
MRTPFIAGNWKMYKTVHDAVLFAKELRSLVKDVQDVEIVVGPPFTAVHGVAEALRNTNVGVAAQDLYWEREGAFTGEVSAEMIREAGAEYVIIGHSERRRLFGETDAAVNRKLGAALTAGLTPIVCVGETLAEREAGITARVVTQQVQEGLEGLDPTDWQRLVLAYEPVWAIGTGRNATPEQAQEVHALIRSLVAERAGGDVAAMLRIQYGGSAKPENAGLILGQPDVDGALVGGASLQAGTFLAIVALASQRRVH